MICINFQVFNPKKGFNLRLRFQQDGVIRYIVVNKLLKGQLQEKHWDRKGQCFKPKAPFSKENNEILTKFKKKYEDVAMDWVGSLESFLLQMKNNTPAKQEEETHKFDDVIELIIEELKKNIREDGTIKGTYEVYEKVQRQMQLFCEFSGLDYDSLCIEDFTPELVKRIHDWIVFKKGNKGIIYISTTLHAILNRCEKMGFFDMDSVKNCNWARKKKSSAHKYHTLSDKQCKKFIELDCNKLRENPHNELYHDFCIFILFTCQSVCDAVSLKYEDIQNIGGVDHFVFKRRKIDEKQSVACTVPINPIMQGIMKKWKPMAKDGYIFPIRSKERIARNKVNNGDIKHFISRLNIWLKYVGDLIGCEFSLHSYTFRHTGITHYISSGVNSIYVANLAGTSVDNCEKIYYNNRGDIENRNQTLNATSF